MLEVPVRYEYIPTLSNKIVDRANASISEYHIGRKALDHNFIFSVFNAQATVELELLKLQYPKQAVKWPNDGYAVIGYWPNA